MQVIHHPSELPRGGRPVCVALGMFDGVHLGHQRVIGQTVQDAGVFDGISLAITFDQHPCAVVAPDRTPPLIQHLSQRLKAMASVGAEAILLIHFDEAFSRQPAEPFIRALTRDAGQIASISIGTNFCFGYKRSGNVAVLRALGTELGFAVRAVPAVLKHGEVVSSTRIREAVQLGKIDLASEMLGRRYTIAGRVVAGERLGRKLGFPTANLDLLGLVLPPVGVYAGWARVAGQDHWAVANIGYRPTVSSPQTLLRTEVHVLGLDREIYGEELEFVFGARLRPEQKFASLNDLRLQISQDIQSARKWLNGRAPCGGALGG
jgi:riboflavin kinase / FMN adenylyltransferase